MALPTAGSDDLTAANAGRHDWLAEGGRQDRQLTVGRVRRRSERRADLEASTTDPDATPMDTTGGVRLGYKTHYVVDGGTARIILAALVTPAEVRDNQPAADLLWYARTRSRYSAQKERTTVRPRRRRRRSPRTDLRPALARGT